MATLKQINDNEIKIAIKTENGKSYFYQWDLNQRLIIENVYENTKIHFSQTNDNKCEALSQTPYTENGVMYVDVPNELLQTDGTINCYVYIDSKNSGYVKEQFSIQVKKREKPEYYDSDLMFSPMVNEILGENIEGGITGKLQYLKDCLDILYQSPPIKLMREAYGENTKFIDFCKNIVKSYENNWAVIGHELSYSSDMFASGFYDGTVTVISPNGMVIPFNNGFICPEIYYLSGNDQIVRFTISAYNVGEFEKTLTNLDILDFRNVRFPVYESSNLFELFNLYFVGNGFCFNAVCTHVDGVYLPKLSVMNQFNFIDCTDSSPAIRNGLHLGQIFMRNDPKWLFRYNDNVNVSKCDKTPVYCDKNFIGNVYLEKLNIDTDCFVNLFNNLAPLTGELYDPEYGYFQYDFSPMIFSIGDYNIQKINSSIQSGNNELKQALDNATAKWWDIQ